tara:strand:- start:2617 stop:3243 length:627 start_codon:yes stop_codon:yes gene_type:complete
MGYEEINVNIPTSWSDITIGMYQDFVKIQKTKYSKEEEKAIDLVCKMTKLEAEKLSRFKYKDLKYLVDKLKKLMDSEIDSETLVKKVEFNNTKYGLIPNFSNISLGEFVDIENNCKDSYSNLHKIMSVMYRPIVKEKGDRYSIEEYNPDEYKEDLFKDFPIVVSVSALSFFFRLGKILKLALLKYSEKEVTKKIARLKRLVKNGGGIA